MKKTILFLTIIMFCCANVTFAAWPECDPKDNNIKILSGVTINGAGGTSTFIVDLRDHCITTGDFSVQFSGVTCGWEDPATGEVIRLSGATINAYYRMSNHMPSGASVFKGLNPHDVSITSALEQVTIVSDLNSQSGNTEYIYDFFPDVCRILVIDITAGATTMVTDVWLDMY